MATVAQKIVALNEQRAALGAKCAQCGIQDVDASSSLYDIMRALYKKATGYTMQFQSGPYDYATELRQLREIMAFAVNKVYGSELDEDAATLPQITEAIVQQEQAYAVCIPDSSGTKYELRFFRSTTAPVVGGTYRGKTIACAYADFESTAYTTNSKVPWYAQHADIASVHFDGAVRPASCAYWFYWMQNCTSFDLALLDTGAATSFAFMFYSCTSVTTLDIAHFQTSNVTSINYMFYNCTKLASISFGAWDMSKLQVCAQAFRNLTQVTVLDLSLWTMPEWTSTMQYMFYNCSKLTTIYVPPGCDLTDTSVNGYCFSGCTKLVGGAGTKFSTANVTADYARVDGLGGQPGYFTAKAH